MEIIKDEHTNIVFEAPGCIPAPAHRDIETGIISFKFKLSKDDLVELIDNNGYIYYSICGTEDCPPPVYPFIISTKPDFTWQK